MSVNCSHEDAVRVIAACNSIGARISALRRAFGLSQQETADALHIHRTLLSTYEADKTTPGIDTVVHVARMFNLSVDELIGDLYPLSADEGW